MSDQRMLPRLATIPLIAAIFSPALFSAAAPAISIQNLSYSPATVDALLGPATLTATVQLAIPPDDVVYGPEIGGFSTLYLDNGRDYVIGAHLGDGNNPPAACPQPVPGCVVYSFPVVVPQGSPAGEYLPSLQVFDPGSGPQFIGTPAIVAALGPNVFLTVTDYGGVQPSCQLPPLQPPPGGGGISDTTPPQLVGICLLPYNLFVTSSPAPVTVTINIADDLSGFNYGWVYFLSPSGNQYFYTYFDTGSLIEGDNLSGIYQFEQWFQPTAESGTWTYQVQISDTVGNWNYAALPPDAPPLNITSTPDTNPPVWVSGNISGTVNVSNGTGTVPVTIHITDDISGFNYGWVYFQSPSGKQTFNLYIPTLQLTGTHNDGVWSGSVTVPQYSEPGAWKIGQVYLQDQAGNNVYMYPGGSLPAPAGGFTVISNPADITPPQLMSLSFTPGAVNTSLGDAQVDINLAFADSPAGLSYCYAAFISPSGNQTHSTGATSISGTLNSGVWKSSVILPRYSELGTWKLYYVNCWDLANNYVQAYTADLAAKGFPTTLIVIQPSLQVDGTFSGANSTVKDTASNTTLSDPNGQLPAGTTAAIDVLAEPPANEPPQGFSIGTGFVSIALNPPVTTPLPPPGLTLTLTVINQMLPGSELALYKIDLASGKLVQVPKSGGGFVTGIVDATGQSAVFTGISTFSTVVGLTPPAKPGDLNGDGLVNCADVRIIRNSWAKRTGQLGFDPRADYNRDGVVNVFDLAAVAKLLPRGTKCP